MTDKGLQLSQATRRSLRSLQADVKSVQESLFMVFGGSYFSSASLVASILAGTAAGIRSKREYDNINPFLWKLSAAYGMAGVMSAAAWKHSTETLKSKLKKLQKAILNFELNDIYVRLNKEKRDLRLDIQLLGKEVPVVIHILDDCFIKQSQHMFKNLHKIQEMITTCERVRLEIDIFLHEDIYGD